MNERPKKRGCRRVALIAVVFLVVLVGCAWMMLFNLSLWTFQGGTVATGKIIFLMLQQYAKDHQGDYPDKGRQEFHSANQVFREFFKTGIAAQENERVFGGYATVFRPDGDIGVPPSFERALMPGECHWMLLKHQSPASHPRTPVLIENALNTTWPPRWDTSSWGEKRGRAWAFRSVVICRNDGAVAVEKLRPDGTMDWHSPPNLDEHGKSWIDYLTPEQVARLEYWDVEEKKP